MPRSFALKSKDYGEWRKYQVRKLLASDDQTKQEYESYKRELARQREYYVRQIDEILTVIYDLEETDEDVSEYWKRIKELEQLIDEIDISINGKVNDGIRYSNGLGREGFLLKIFQKCPFVDIKFVIDALMDRLDEEEQLLLELLEQDYILEGDYNNEIYSDKKLKNSGGKSKK